MTAETSRCDNCGAPLHLDITPVKCSYCGSSYQGKSPIKTESRQQYVQSSTVWQNEQNTAPDPDADGSMKGGCALVVIVFIIIVIGVIKSESDKHSSFNGSGYDTVSIDTTGSSGLFGGNVDTTYIQRTNPDPEVVIKSSKIYSTDLMTHLSVTYKNNAKTDDVITYIEFQYKIFDKKGLLLNTGEQDIRGTGTSLDKGATETNEWSLGERLPKAKKIIVKLKRVEFGHVVWEY